MDVTAVVLAGGLGTRLRGVVADRPKVLAEVAGRPFLSYILDQLADAHITRVVLSTGYMAEQFADVIGHEYRGIEVTYAHEEAPLGTGGAIKFAGGQATGGHLLVMNGDSYFDADLSAYIAWHLSGGQDVSLLLVDVPDASRYGTVRLNEESPRVAEFLEKRPQPVRGLINAGVYLLQRDMLEHIPPGPCSIERDVFPRWLNEFDVRAWTTDGAFIDIGIPEDYERSHEFMQRVTS
jgi:NDP-sugar pyrophosphorylase family protein